MITESIRSKKAIKNGGGRKVTEKRKKNGRKRTRKQNETKTLRKWAKLQFEKLAAQLKQEGLQFDNTRMERKNIETRMEVQPAASSQVDQENVKRGCDDQNCWATWFRVSKDNLYNYLLQIER